MSSTAASPGNTAKRIALDTNVVLDLARGEDFAHDFRESLQGSGCLLGCPPTVLMELQFLATRGEEAEAKRLAVEALCQFRAWHLQGWVMVPVANGISDLFQAHLARLGLLPPEEINDGLIIAETSLAGMRFLASSDQHLLGIPTDKLAGAMQDKHLTPVEICHPRRFVRLLGRR